MTWPILQALDARLSRRYLQRCQNIADLRRVAQRRVPAPMFHYMDGAAEDEITYRRNSSDFDHLEFALDRRPSAFTGIDATDPDTRLPDYRFANRPGTPSLRRLLGLRVARGVGAANAPTSQQTLEEFVKGKVSNYGRLADPALQSAEFEQIVTKMLDALGASELGLSVNDQFAAYYAVLMSGPQLGRRDIQATGTIQRDLAEFRRFKFYVPAAQ